MRRRSEGVIGYIRVSTEEQALSGLGLADQRSAIENAAKRREWPDLHVIADEGFSAKSLSRPGISEALNLLKRGEASILVVSKLDRLSRSLLDFCTLVDRARREGWNLVVLDVDMDMTTPNGELMANVMAAFAHYERRLIAQRTSAALQQKKAQGARLGRPVTLASEVRERIVQSREAGESLASIAEALNQERVPTARGGRSWYPSTVSAVLKSSALDKKAS